MPPTGPGLYVTGVCSHRFKCVMELLHLAYPLRMHTRPIPIAVVDDHTLMRNALSEMIQNTEGFNVVAEAVNGAEYIRAVKQGTEVAVAVVDLNMPVMNGFETIAWIRANTPGTRALALTFEAADDVLERAMQAGACGFLRKDSSKAQFLDAVEQVALRGHFRSRTEEQIREQSGDRRNAALHKLTQRELEFIGLLCGNGDLTNEQLAARMQVHRRTIDGYVEATYKKCEVHSKAGLVAFAYKFGIV